MWELRYRYRHDHHWFFQPSGGAHNTFDAARYASAVIGSYQMHSEIDRVTYVER